MYSGFKRPDVGISSYSPTIHGSLEAISNNYKETPKKIRSTNVTDLLLRAQIGPWGRSGWRGRALGPCRIAGL